MVFHRKRSVTRARSRAAPEASHPRSSAIQSPLRPKPVAAMLEMAASLSTAWGARFIIMPVSGCVRSQKRRKLACSSSSRNASSPGEKPGVGMGLLEALARGTMAPAASVARRRAVFKSIVRRVNNISYAHRESTIRARARDNERELERRLFKIPAAKKSVPGPSLYPPQIPRKDFVPFLPVRGFMVPMNVQVAVLCDTSTDNNGKLDLLH